MFTGKNLNYIIFTLLLVLFSYILRFIICNNYKLYYLLDRVLLILAANVSPAICQDKSQGVKSSIEHGVADNGKVVKSVVIMTE